jgi:hypothetical protein
MYAIPKLFEMKYVQCGYLGASRQSPNSSSGRVGPSIRFGRQAFLPALVVTYAFSIPRKAVQIHALNFLSGNREKSKSWSPVQGVLQMLPVW